jgi:hypothetical protein
MTVMSTGGAYMRVRSSYELPAAEVRTVEMSAAGASDVEVPATDVPATDVSTADGSSADVSTAGMSATVFSSRSIRGKRHAAKHKDCSQCKD